MADLAMYRKYRPQNFENLVGQEAISKTLLNAIESGHLSHAYLFCGPRGTGKTTTARLVAKAINCISPEPGGESCNKCEYCVLMSEGRLVDLIEIDAASNRGIDEIRDLREKIKFSPSQAPHKVYIIDEVHMLTTPAFNALLKTLEEPPSHAYFILATTEVHKVPDTILSRCQRFDFHRIDDNVLIQRLKHIAKQENIEVEETALALIARSSEGGMRDAISLFEQMISGGQLSYEEVANVLGVSGRDTAGTLLDALEKKDLKAALTQINELHRDGYDLAQFNRDFLEVLRTKMLDSMGKKDMLAHYVNWIDLFQTASKDLKYTVIPQLPLEIAVVKSLMEEEAKGGWFSGILGGTPKVAPKEKEVKVEKKAAEAEGLKAVPAETVAEVVPVTTPQKEAAPTPVSDASPIEVTPANIQLHLSRIADLIKSPGLRQSFKTSVVREVKGEEVHLEFQSKFHLEKLENSVSKSEVERAFEQIFSTRVKLICHLTAPTKLVDASLEIFGGELIDS